MCQHCVWVIGEAGLAEALAKGLNQPQIGSMGAKRWSPGAGDRIEATHRVVVLADLPRGDLEGLRLFEEALADPQNAVRHALVLTGQELDTGHVNKRYRYLLEPGGFLSQESQPLSAAVTAQKLAEPLGTDPADEMRWLLLQLDALSHRLGSIGSAYTHRQQSVRGAVRIYLGALQAGVAKRANAEVTLDVLSNCASQAGDTGVVTAAERQRLLAEMAVYRKLIRSPQTATALKADLGEDVDWKNRQRTFSDPEGRLPWSEVSLWLLDDEAHTLGWYAVLSEITPGRVTAFTSPDDLPTNSADDVTALLIDCDMAGNRLAGLDLAPSLRERWWDLPIIMMTAFDHAELAKEALRSGCSGFFVKELSDIGDRDSLSYFRAFERAVRRREEEPQLRALWRRFVTREARLKRQTGRHKGDPAAAAIRYSFYLLFSLADENSGTVQLLTPSIKKSERVRVASRHAILSAFIATQHVGRPPGGEWFSGDTERLVKSARHGQPHAFTMSDALLVLEQLIEKLEIRYKPQPLSRHCSQSGSRERLISDDLLKVSEAEKIPGYDHLGRSERGALQLLLGRLLGSGQFPPEEALGQFANADREGVLAVVQGLLAQHMPLLGNSQSWKRHLRVVDDDAEVTGWQLVLPAVLAPYGIQPHFEMQGDSRPDYDAAVTDLYRLAADPGELQVQDGLANIGALTASTPWAPAVVLSASTETVHAIDCLRSGALDYFPKWLLAETSPQRWQLAAQRFVDTIRGAVEIGSAVPWEDYRLQLLRTPGAIKAALTTATAARGGFGFTPEEAAQQVDFYFRAATVHLSRAVVDEFSKGDQRLLADPIDHWRVTRLLAFESYHAAQVTLNTFLATDLLALIAYRWRTHRPQALPRPDESTYPDLERYTGNIAEPVWDVRNQLRLGNTQMAAVTRSQAETHLRLGLMAAEAFAASVRA